MRRLIPTLLTLLAAVAARAAPLSVTDDLGNTLTLPAPATRIVSLSPGGTEMLFAAGAGSHVIATVEYADEPPAAKQVPRIGDVVSVDIERLVAMHPDVVVVWPGGGNGADIGKIGKLAIPLYRQQADTLAALPDSLRRLGRLAGTQAVADRNASELAARLQSIAAQYSREPPVTAFIQVWSRPLYTVGGKQLMTDAFALCGVRNVFADLKEASPVVEVEAVIARNPDMIVAVTETAAAAGWLEEWRRFPSMNAVKSGRLVSFQDARLVRLGPSAVEATEALCKRLAAARINATR
jgi:iron complex transport system substrate-binding protein